MVVQAPPPYSNEDAARFEAARAASSVYSSGRAGPPLSDSEYITSYVAGAFALIGCFFGIVSKNRYIFFGSCALGVFSLCKLPIIPPPRREDDDMPSLRPRQVYQDNFFPTGVVVDIVSALFPQPNPSNRVYVDRKHPGTDFSASNTSTRAVSPSAEVDYGNQGTGKGHSTHEYNRTSFVSSTSHTSDRAMSPQRTVVVDYGNQGTGNGHSAHVNKAVNRAFPISSRDASPPTTRSGSRRDEWIRAETSSREMSPERKRSSRELS